MKKILLGLLISTNVFALESRECAQGLSLPITTIAGLDLTQKMQNILGVSPLFCRKAKVSSDDKNDDELKKMVDKLLAQEKSQIAADQVSKITFDVMTKVAMKKLWSMADQKTQTQIYFSPECESSQLNKWPVFKNKGFVYNGEKAKESKILNDFKKLCSPKLTFETLAPYLSKDVVTESMFILGRVYPNDFKTVADYTCKQFAQTPEAIFKDDNYGSFVLGESNIEDREQFGDWLKNALSYKVRFDSQKDSVNVKIRELFQMQERTKTLYEILTPDEVSSIQQYTGESYVDFNACLRRDTCVSDTKSEVEKINNALKKVKNASNKKDDALLFRGLANLPSFIRKAMDDAIVSGNAIVVDKAFLSTSGNGTTAKRFSTLEGVGGALLVIKNKSCVGISEISLMKAEDEFLCPSGMKFKITKSGVEDVYNLEEVE